MMENAVGEIEIGNHTKQKLTKVIVLCMTLLAIQKVRPVIDKS